VREESVVGEPVVPDHHEADEEAGDLGNLVVEGVLESLVAGDRDPDAHHEERHRDGEHRVAEEHHPVELERG
jgi:hypothetical protein